MLKNWVNKYQLDIISAESIFTFFSLTFIFLLLVIPVVGFYIGVSVSTYEFFIAYLFSFALTFICADSDKSTTFKHLIFSSLIIIFSIVIAYFFQDFHWDSREYHIPASIQIAQGWNPITHPLPAIPQMAINFFPKAQWYINAIMMHVTGSIETGKFTHLIILVASFLIVKRAINKTYGLGGFLLVFIALIISLNPIAIMQLGLNYTDGVVASLLTILLFSLLRLSYSNDKEFLYYALICTALLSGIKTTGLIYSAIFWFGFFITILFNNNIKKKVYLKLSIGLTVIVLFLNYNPYITNTVNHGSPFYPFLTIEKGTVDSNILKRPYYKDMNRFERFFIAYTSSTKFISASETDPWKTWISPFRFKNISNFWFLPDMARTNGGFGPVFGFVLFLTFFLCVFCSRNEAIFLLTLLLSIFLHNEGWHARYTPQVWLMPSIILLSTIVNSNIKRAKYLAILAFAVMGGSILLLIVNYPNQINNSKEYFNNLEAYYNSNGIIDDNFIDQYIPELLRNKPKEKDKFFRMTEKERVKQLGYNFRENVERIGKIDLLSFLKMYSKENIAISIRDDGTKSLDINVINFINSMGGNIDNVNYRDSYAAIISEGQVTHEKILSGSAAEINHNIINESFSIKVKSSGLESGNLSSIIINDREYSPNKRGLNIVAFKETMAIVASFDTFKEKSPRSFVKFKYINK